MSKLNKDIEKIREFIKEREELIEWMKKFTVNSATADIVWSEHLRIEGMKIILDKLNKGDKD